MALGNNYQEGNSEEFFFKRTNPLANGANAEILKVSECGTCDIELNAEIVTSGNTTTLTFNAPTSAYTDITVFTVQVTDGQGNFVTEQSNGSGATLNTAALNSAVEWRFTILIERGDLSPAIGCACSKKFNFDYNPTLGLIIDTETMGEAIVQFRSLVDTVITTLGLGTYVTPAGSIGFSFYAKNIGSTVLDIDSISVDGTAVTSAAIQSTVIGANIVFPNQQILISGTVDGNLSAGAQAGTVTLVTNVGSVVLPVTYTLT